MMDIKNDEKIRWYSNSIRRFIFYPIFLMITIWEFFMLWELYNTTPFSVAFNIQCILVILGFCFFLSIIYLYVTYGVLSLGIGSSGIYFRDRNHIEKITWKEIQGILPVITYAWEGIRLSHKQRTLYALILRTHVVIIPWFVVENKETIEEIIKMYEINKKARRENGL